MKIKLSVILVIALTNLQAQKNDYFFTYTSFNKNFAKVDSVLYADKFEVTNAEYREFMADLLRNGKTEIFKQATIDTSGWTSKQAYNQPYVELYYRHPAYQNYPLVNVSYEAAKLYCSWLTSVYNSDPKRKFKKVIFRLPTKSEWEKAAHGGLEYHIYPWEGPFLKNKDCWYMCNFNNIGEEEITFDTIIKKYVVSETNNFGIAGYLNDNSDITNPVNSYYPNGFGIYNMAGNVSEMIEEKEIAKGGSWISPGYDVRIASGETYSGSSNHIGFRVFMEVLE